MSRLIVTKSLLDDLADSISAKSGESTPMTIAEMTDAVDSIQTTPTLQTKTKSYPPSETARSETVTADNGYDGLSSVSISVEAIPSSYVGSGITYRSSSDLTASGATVTAPIGYYPSQATKSVASGTAGTPTATKGVVSNHAVTVTPSVTNTTGFITGSTINGTAVSVSASELVFGSQTVTENDTYDVTNLAELVVNVSGGGSTGVTVATKTTTLASSSFSIQFTGLLGNPTSFAVTSNDDIAINTGSTTAVIYDGTSLHGQTITSQATASTDFTKSYSNGTLTVTGGDSMFLAGDYKLVYTYGGSSSDIHTADVQVGSGATSITFTSLSGKPAYFSCVFKSDFSTSSGYQRVIDVVNDGTNTYGNAFDSSAKAQTSWSYSYSGGSLTITSTGTNNGGYFHQPGYYQLTYAVDPNALNLQQKTGIGASTSSQTITADTGYDALESVQINAVSQTNLEAGNIKSGTTISISNGQSNLWSVTGTYTGGGGGANFGTVTMTNSNSQAQSIDFTLPSGRTPKAFFARLTTQITRNSSSRYYYVENMRWDGSATGGVAGRCYYMYSGQLTNITSGYSYSQNGTTFTLSSTGTRSASPGSFYNGTYELVYVY